MEGAAETGANGRAGPAGEAPVGTGLGGDVMADGTAADDDMAAEDDEHGGEPDPIDLQRQQEIQVG